MKIHLLSLLIYALTTLIGVVAFLYPFWQPTLGQPHAADAPLMLSLLVGICFVVLLLEVQGQGMSAKIIALLGILVAINAMLRFVELAIPVPGFSFIFLLIILTGYVFGGRFGFLMGALTMLVSALITGGVGPWLPYQMFTAAWIGLSAPLCRPFANGRWAELVTLSTFGALWGFIFGVIINLWFWPFTVGSPDQYWQPGITLSDTLTRYATFYLATSLVLDGMRALGNALLLMAFGLPILRVLRRFQQRFTFEYRHK
jgi:energy-coupling factor transport system substrate-specific component